MADDSSLDSEVTGHEDDELVAELEGTIEKMTERLSSDEKDVAALITRGEAWFDLGEREKAEADLKKALELEPESASTNLAWARAQLGEADDSVVLEHVQKAIQIDTIKPGENEVDKATGYDDESRALAQRILAEAQLNTENLEAARKAIDHALELSGEDSDFLVFRGNVRRLQGELEEAIADLRKAIELDEDEPGPRVELAMALLESGEVEQAFEELDAAFDKADAGGLLTAELHSTRGDAHAARGDRLRAREDYRRAIELDDEFFDAHLGLAEIAIQDQDHEIAERHIKRALEIDDEDSEVHFTHGVLLRAKEDLAGSEKALSRAIELADDYAAAFHIRGLVRKELGNDEGDKDLEKAKDLGLDLEGDG